MDNLRAKHEKGNEAEEDDRAIWVKIDLPAKQSIPWDLAMTVMTMITMMMMATTTMAMTGPVPVPERGKVYSIFFTKYNGMTLLWRVTFIAWKNYYL